MESRAHFTDKLRDQESGNDDFGARYFSSTLGRFLSADWSAEPEAVPYAKLDDPQSLNLYSYVGNNPLSRVDKDGHQEAIPTPLGPLPLFFPQQQITQQQAGQMALDIRDFISTLGQVISEDAAHVGSVGTAISNVFKSSDSTGSGEPPQLAAGKEAHKSEEVRPGERAEVPTPSGSGRMDRYDEDKAHRKRTRMQRKTGLGRYVAYGYTQKNRSRASSVTR